MRDLVYITLLYKVRISHYRIREHFHENLVGIIVLRTSAFFRAAAYFYDIYGYKTPAVFGAVSFLRENSCKLHR